jgi:hypothetical protein
MQISCTEPYPNQTMNIGIKPRNLLTILSKVWLFTSVTKGWILVGILRTTKEISVWFQWHCRKTEVVVCGSHTYSYDKHMMMCYLVAKVDLHNTACTKSKVSRGWPQYQLSGLQFSQLLCLHRAVEKTIRLVVWCSNSVNSPPNCSIFTPGFYGKGINWFKIEDWEYRRDVLPSTRWVNHRASGRSHPEPMELIGIIIVISGEAASD